MSTSRHYALNRPSARYNPPVAKSKGKRAAPRRRTRAQPGRTFIERVRRAIERLTLGVFVAGAVLFLSLDGQSDPRQARAAAEWLRNASERPVWLVDVNGDGLADLANPTRNFVRGADLYGSGTFGAGRDHSRRRHMGTDFIAIPGEPVRAPLGGIVTLTGYAYGNDPFLRFMEISDKERGLHVRLFYVQPGVRVGKEVKAGDIIGAAQTLDKRYPLITNHVHVEIRDAKGAFLDPALMLPPTRAPRGFAAIPHAPAPAPAATPAETAAQTVAAPQEQPQSASAPPV